MSKVASTSKSVCVSVCVCVCPSVGSDVLEQVILWKAPLNTSMATQHIDCSSQMLFQDMLACPLSPVFPIA